METDAETTVTHFMDSVFKWELSVKSLATKLRESLRREGGKA